MIGRRSEELVEVVRRLITGRVSVREDSSVIR